MAFVSPDAILARMMRYQKPIAFIYTDDGKLFKSREAFSHANLSHDNNDGYKDYYQKRFGTEPQSRPIDRFLVGRVAFDREDGIKVVSFWNSDDEENPSTQPYNLFMRLLPGCMKKLQGEGLIDDDSLIYSRFSEEPIPYEQFKKTGFSKVNPNASLDINKMHLLRGDEKKQALLRAGASPKVSPWKDLTPGQKHWALNSESLSFKEWLKNEEGTSTACVAGFARPIMQPVRRSPKKKKLLETPISHFELLGNWDDKKRKYGYQPDDVGILTSEKGVEKIKRKWENVRQDFDLYFLKSPIAYKQTEIGRVNDEFLRDELKINLPPINRDNITVIYTNNIGAERVPMTAWTMAHRFGHAIRREPEAQEFDNKIKNALSRFLQFYYNRDIPQRSYGFWKDGEQKNYRQFQTLLLNLAKSLGTMKSARTGNIFRLGEFTHELLAQYITTGKIKFNDFPKQVPHSYAWGRPQGPFQRGDGSEDLRDLELELMNDCDWLLDSMIGKIFVM